jgi:hypothetical protein
LLPALQELEAAVQAAIAACQDLMVHTTVKFEDELKKGKQKPEEEGGDEEESGDEANP